GRSTNWPVAVASCRCGIKKVAGAAGAADGGISCQRATEQNQIPLIEDGTPEAGAAPTPACPASLGHAGIRLGAGGGTTVGPLGEASGHRQVLQGQAGAEGDVEDAKRRRTRITLKGDAWAYCRALDAQPVIDQEGRRPKRTVPN